MACLEAARAVGASDWYLAAGFVRNLIWDHLHSKKEATPLNDVDFVYFDPHDKTSQAEDDLRTKLTEFVPGASWEVRNQARMHIRNSHLPYSNTEEAIAHWPEIPTCVGARLQDDGRIAIIAPFGLDDNWSLDVRPNPRVHPPPEVFVRRVKEKNWLGIWPGLKIHWPDGFDPANLG